jgi:Fic family protein
MPRPGWDEESPQLWANLDRVADLVVKDAIAGAMPSLDMARRWHRMMMQGLGIPGDAPGAGMFRGDPGTLEYPVGIGGVACMRCRDVAAALQRFEAKLRSDIATLDKKYPRVEDLDQAGIHAALDLAAWAHAEWVRIHPFANGNGRTARAWANFVLRRFGMPPAIKLRPRPDGGYSAAAAASMANDLNPTIQVFISMIREAITGTAPKTPRRNAPR